MGISDDDLDSSVRIGWREKVKTEEVLENFAYVIGAAKKFIFLIGNKENKSIIFLM